MMDEVREAQITDAFKRWTSGPPTEDEDQIFAEDHCDLSRVTFRAGFLEAMSPLSAPVASDALPCQASRPMNEGEECQNYECNLFDPDCDHSCSGRDGDGYAAETCREWKQPCNAVAKLREAIAERERKARQEIEQRYEEIHKWLLGEVGDFPPSEPGRRYGWRTELSARLAAIKEAGNGN